MRILLLNYEYPPLGGGAGVASKALAHCLADGGHSVDVVTAGTSQSTELCRTDRRLRVFRVRSRRRGRFDAGLGGAGDYLVSALPVVRWLIRKSRYDVAHLFFSLPTGVLLPFIRRAGLPTVVSLRGSDVPGYDPANRKLQIAHLALKPVTRRIWRSADHVVALSRALGALALRTDPGLVFSVIHNGVDTELFRPPNPARTPVTERVRCIAVARLVERKGLADLLVAFRSLDAHRFSLEIVGSGNFEQELRALAGHLGLLERVHFTGALDHSAVADRYRHADLFTLPSWDESFGNAFAEALASGLPIVGSDVGGIPEFVEHGSNGLLVPPKSPSSIAAAIRLLADDPPARERIARANRSKALSQLSWAAVAARYLQVYASVAKGGVEAPAGAAPKGITP
jgi:glycosyltransferase involved in cell wall biosynthesis